MNLSNKLYLYSQIDFINFIEKDSDNYLTDMTKYDLIARKVSSNLHLRIKSSLGFEIFSKKYVSQLQEFIPKINIFLESINLPSKIGWVICGINDNYESGLPHTREKIIFIKPHTNIITLLHERIHILQRKSPELFKELIKEEITNQLKPELQRANPDINDVMYVNKFGELLSECYTTINPSSISDVIGMKHPYEQIAYNISNLF